MSIIIENLQHLKALIEATPDTVIDLQHFKSECGTHFCALGLAACATHFNQQGLTLESVKDKYWLAYQAFEPVLNGAYLLSDAAHRSMDNLFGLQSFARLFDARDQGFWDYPIYDTFEAEDEPTDKQLALARIDRQLEALQ